ncbi:MAG: TIGR04211 family SH3 domain-containing protein [Deltaproteobacteria bacterium]|nr:MAG: TIGR04211 family SH3 domain-containing protein [Deltaproteobacteria bacterium]
MTVSRIRKPSLLLLFLLLILMSAQVGTAQADRRYVSDRLIISLREAPNSDGKALGTIKTDDPVEVLEESGPYLRVKTGAGEEGWVPGQYVTAETPKPIIIAQLKDEMNRLREKIREYEGAENPFLDKLKAAEESYLQKVKELEQNASKLVDERNELKAANAALNRELRNLQKRIETVRGSGKLQWFLAGAAVFCLGLFVGQVSKRKKRYYIDL